jgi:DNA-binding NarL/FixJ family response regulator
VILLDYQLPDINADQVVERLLSPGTGLGAEVLIVTVGLPAGAEAALRRYGVETVIEKTEGMEAVVDAVRRALARRSRTPEGRPRRGLATGQAGPRPGYWELAGGRVGH